MNLDDAQKKQVAGWIEQGLKLSEIQKRLESDFGLRITYLEVRLLVDDLKLTPKDQPRGTTEDVLGKVKTPAEPTPSLASPAQAPVNAPAAGEVSVRVDSIARPGALVSGSVTFSDGKSAAWYLDQMGRLGLAPKEQGYKPSPVDLQEFQIQLQSELQRAGFM